MSASSSSYWNMVAELVVQKLVERGLSKMSAAERKQYLSPDVNELERISEDSDRLDQLARDLAESWLGEFKFRSNRDKEWLSLADQLTKEMRARGIRLQTVRVFRSMSIDDLKISLNSPFNTDTSTMLMARDLQIDWPTSEFLALAYEPVTTSYFKTNASLVTLTNLANKEDRLALYGRYMREERNPDTKKTTMKIFRNITPVSILGWSGSKQILTIRDDEKHEQKLKRTTTTEEAGKPVYWTLDGTSWSTIVNANVSSSLELWVKKLISQRTGGGVTWSGGHLRSMNLLVSISDTCNQFFKNKQGGSQHKTKTKTKIKNGGGNIKKKHRSSSLFG